MSRAKRRLADAISLASNKSQYYALTTTVVGISPGTSVDGRAEVTIALGADSVTAPYLDSYSSPALGDSVRVEMFQGSPIITGRVVGLPNVGD